MYKKNILYRTKRLQADTQQSLVFQIIANWIVLSTQHKALNYSIKNK